MFTNSPKTADHNRSNRFASVRNFALCQYSRSKCQLYIMSVFECSPELLESLEKFRYSQIYYIVTPPFDFILFRAQ